MSVKPKLKAAINVYGTSKKEQIMEVYYSSYIEIYKSSGRDWILESVTPHKF